MPAWGQCTEEQKLTASDAAAGDWFSTVSVSGDTAIVGARLNDSAAGADAGAAYIYVRSGGVLTQQQKLTASDAGAGDQFGSSVSVSGDTAIVGAYHKNSKSGSAYVFVRTGTVWTQQQKLTASDAAAGEDFGTSISLSGDTAVVGAEANDSSGTGSVYVFVHSGTVWTEQQKLTPSDAAARDIFGTSVSVSGDTAVIGAALADHSGGTDAGAAYVFVRSGTVWAQQQKLTALDASASDYFGYSVSVNEDTAMITAEGDDNAAGSAYVFVRTGTVWTQRQKLTASDAAAGDNFGTSVCLSGDTAVIGAYANDDAGPDSGSAYVFSCIAAPVSDPSDIDKVRYISFQIPTDQTGQSALQAKLVSLMHPDPPNLPQFPPPSFAAQEGTVRYVGTPGDCPETESPPATFKCAMLQCMPVYLDWEAALGSQTLHVTGQAVVPSSTYEVRQLAASCQGNESTCAAVSAPLTIATARWGDVASAFQSPFPAPLTQPNISDVAACVDKFKSVPTAIIVARADVNPTVPNGRIDIADVANIVDAFKNLAYPFPGPAACP